MTTVGKHRWGAGQSSSDAFVRDLVENNQQVRVGGLAIGFGGFAIWVGGDRVWWVCDLGWWRSGLELRSGLVAWREGLVGLRSGLVAIGFGVGGSAIWADSVVVDSVVPVSADLSSFLFRRGGGNGVR
uniref:Uncharacterized protein n=1 Tax=Fagus sylvatica TaxID=28930 RepID=A0A2N9I6D6_FAGSY